MIYFEWKGRPALATRSVAFVTEEKGGPWRFTSPGLITMAGQRLTKDEFQERFRDWDLRPFPKPFDAPLEPPPMPGRWALERRGGRPRRKPQ